MKYQALLPHKKSLFALLIIALPLMAMLPWKTKRLQSYFPLREGSMWQYNVYSPTDHQLDVHDSIFSSGDTLINRKRYVLIEGGKNGRVFPEGYWRFEKTKLYRYHTIKKCDVLFADFSLQKSGSSNYTSDSLHTAHVLSADTTYTTPRWGKASLSDEVIGPITFTHVYCVEWTEQDNAERVILFFRQDVGLVGLKMSSGDELYLNGWAMLSK